jgi:hypothetical protein
VAEQTVERLRKPEDGTRARGWNLSPMVDATGGAAKRHETLAGWLGIERSRAGAEREGALKGSERHGRLNPGTYNSGGRSNGARPPAGFGNGSGGAERRAQ